MHCHSSPSRSRREDKLLNPASQAIPALSGEAELIVRAQGGEEKAFDELFHAHQRRVHYLCLRMIGNAAEAEELTQEAFLQLFRTIHTFRGESAFSSWLHRLSVNIVLMRLRKKRLKEIPVEIAAEDEKSEWPQKEFGAPDLVLLSLVDRVCLDRAIAELPPGYRHVFVLHDVLGCEHHEIAAMLGYSVGNSKSQLHRARTRLRNLLQEAGRERQHHKELPSRTRLARPIDGLRSSRVRDMGFDCCTPLGA